MRIYGKALAAVVMAAALCLNTAPFYAAAATQPALTAKAKADASTPAGTVELALEAVKAVDIEAFNRLTDNIRKDGTSTTGMTLFGDENSNLSEGDKKLAQELFRNLSWTVGAVTQSGDTATVALKITNADFTSVLGVVVKEAMGQAFGTVSGGADSMDRMMELILAAQKDAGITLEATAKVVKTGGVWKVHLDDNLVNAVCGNLLTGLNDSMDELDAVMEKFAAMLNTADMQKQIAEAVDMAEIEKQIENAMREAFK